MLGINKITITPAILRQISEIDEFKGLWKGLDRHTTGLQLLGDVADYGAQFGILTGALKEEPISLQMICILHATHFGEKGTLSAFRDGDMPLEFLKGEDVAGVLQTAEAGDIEPLLGKLCEWVNESVEKAELHPLLVAAVFMAVFLQISPFEKGNFYIAWFLLILILLKAGYVYAPYVSLASVMEEKATVMFRALEANQKSLEAGRPDWGEWVMCFLMLLQDQKEILYQRLYGKETELRSLPALSSKIMALFKEHQRLQMKQIEKLTRGRRATIKLRLKELVEAGYLHRHGNGRGTWYSLV